MSLTYSYAYCDPRPESPQIEKFAFLTMFIGIPVLTEKNAEEFFQRVYIWETLYRPQERTTLTEVRAMVGFRTNAEPYTNARFGKEVLKRLRLQASDRLFKESAAD